MRGANHGVKVELKSALVGAGEKKNASSESGSGGSPESEAGTGDTGDIIGTGAKAGDGAGAGAGSGTGATSGGAAAPPGVTGAADAPAPRKDAADAPAPRKRTSVSKPRARPAARDGAAGPSPEAPASVPAGAEGAGAGMAVAAAAPSAAAPGVPIKRKASAMSSDTAKEGESAEPTTPKKRFAWTDELHRIFMASIFDVGLRQAKPKIILQNMGESPEGLTTEHIKSHLQKYRFNSKRTKELFLKQFEIACKDAAASGDSKAINPGFHAYPMPVGRQHVLHPELFTPSLLEVGMGDVGNIVSSVRPHIFFPTSREAQLYLLGQPAPPGLALQGLPHMAHAAPPPLQQQQQAGHFIHDCPECAAAAASEAGHEGDGLGAGGRSLLRGGAPHHHHYAYANANAHHHSQLAAGNMKAEQNGGRAQAPHLLSQMELQMRIHKEFEEKHDSRLGSRAAAQLPRPPPLPAALRAAAHSHHHQQQHTHHLHHIKQLHHRHLDEQAIALAHAREGASSSSSSSAAAAAAAVFPTDAPTPGQQQGHFEQLETSFYESAPQQNVHMSPLLTSSAMTLIEQQPFPELEPLDDGELFSFMH
jgi:SHAQKYF class myb-like DNA-binding protein